MKNSFTILTTTFSLLLLVAGFLATPTPAAAQVNTVVNGGSGTNAQRQVVTLNRRILNQLTSLVEKELQRDPAAEIAANQAMRDLNTRVQQVVASGYRGSPVFIENLEVHIAQIRASTTINVLNEIRDTGNVCGAFKDEILAEVRTQFIEDNFTSVASQQQCSLEEGGGDAAAFLEGEEFTAENGLNMLWRVAYNPEQNTRQGAIAKIQNQIANERATALENELTRLNWSRGIKDLYANDPTLGPADVIACTQGEINGIRDNCRVAKPGSIWFEEIVKGLNLPLERAANMQEIGSDAATQLFTGLANQSIAPPSLGIGTGGGTSGGGTSGGGTSGGGTSGGGTSGGGTSGGGITIPIPGFGFGNDGNSGGAVCGTGPGNTNPTSPNYLTPGGLRICQVPSDPNSQVTQRFLGEVATTSSNTSTSSNNPVQPVLIRTLTKLQYQLQTVSLIDAAESRRQTAANDPEYQSIGCYTLAFPNNLQNERTLTLTEIPFTLDALKELYPLFVEYERAVANNTPTTQILTNFQRVNNDNFAIPTAVDLNGIADKYNSTTGSQIVNFNRDHNRQVNACETILNPPEENDPGDS